MSEPLWRRYLRFRGSDPTADADDELAFHFEMRVEELVSRGTPEPEARERAEREFGDVRSIRAELHEIGRRRHRRERRVSWWSDLRQDVRFGVRAAVRAPLFALLAIATLALGIGANAAVFGVVKSVLLDSLPYHEADRLVRVYGRFLDGTQELGAVSAGTVHDFRERAHSFERLSAFQGWMPDAVISGEGAPHVAKVAWVEHDFFRTLGVSPTMGRAFVPEDVDPDTARVAVVAHSAWQRLLGGDPDVVGRDVRVNGIPRTVIGVLPSDFVGPMGEADFYFPLDISPTLASPVSARRSHWLGIVARLRPGVSHEEAGREMDALWADIVREHPQDHANLGIRAMSIRDAMVGDTRTPLLVLMASAALVLLIACANLAGALLSRTISRRKEFAVRVAMGARRGRLIRQLLTESTLLALLGGAVGIALAAAGLRLARGLALPALPEYADLSLDPAVVGVGLAVALLTGLAFGLAPALSVAHADPQGTLRDGSGGAGENPRSRRMRGLMVAGQIALCVTLLAGATLLGRSLWAMTTAPLGFDADGVLTVSVQLPGADYGSAAERLAFYHQLEERLRALPGVTEVASASSVPTAVMSSMGVTVLGAEPPPDDQQPFVLFATVSDDYFRTLGIPLRLGRTFDARDHADGPPTAVISESMARRHWPDPEAALGSHIRLGPDREAPPIEVVGIVGDVRNDPVLAEAEPMAYVSIRQQTWPVLAFLIRGEDGRVPPVRAVEEVLAGIDPGLPLVGGTTLREMLGEGLAGRRLPAALMMAFGVLALLLASVGVYAMFATMAAAREREFGVRMALGSTPGAIAALVVRQGVVWLGVGLAAGAVGVVLIVRLLRDLLYGVAPFDPVSLGITTLLLLGCAVVALLVPVRRATRVDPATALQAR